MNATHSVKIMLPNGVEAHYNAIYVLKTASTFAYLRVDEATQELDDDNFIAVDLDKNKLTIVHNVFSLKREINRIAKDEEGMVAYECDQDTVVIVDNKPE